MSELDSWKAYTHRLYDEIGGHIKMKWRMRRKLRSARAAERQRAERYREALVAIKEYSGKDEWTDWGDFESVDNIVDRALAQDAAVQPDKERRFDFQGGNESSIEPVKQDSEAAEPCGKCDLCVNGHQGCYSPTAKDKP